MIKYQGAMYPKLLNFNGFHGLHTVFPPGYILERATGKSVMRVLQNLQNYLTRQLSQTSKLDGRLLLLAILIVYFVPIFIASLAPNYPESWKSPWIFPLVLKILPSFADLRVITAGAECVRLGYDVLIENPCDPWQRQMNYPRVWSIPASWGLNQSHTVILGLLCGSLFFILTFITIEHLNYIEALFYALVLCSPSVMFAVERGNNDLIIFTLLALSLLTLKSRSSIWYSFFYIIMLLASILKLYPIFGLAGLYKEKPKSFASIFTTLTGFGIYVVLNFESLKLVSKATPRSSNLSYGGMVIFDTLFPNYLNGMKLPIFVLSISIVFFIAYLLAKSGSALYQNSYTLTTNRIDAFLIGSSIYMGTFLIGNNWDYRLIFLLFTIPQMLSWLKDRSCLAPISGLVLMMVILTAWLSSCTNRVYHLDELINWLLFLFFSYTFLLILPKRLKDYRFSI
jgi:hypothetical protein